MMNTASIGIEWTSLVAMEKTFSALVKERIDAAYRGSQAEFARATGFKPQTVNTWLKGRVTLPQLAARRVLARELGISMVDLLVALGELERSDVEESGAEPAANPEWSRLPRDVQQALRDADWTRPGLAQTVASVLAIARGVDPVDVLAVPDTDLDMLRAYIKSGEIDERGAGEILDWWIARKRGLEGG